MRPIIDGHLDLAWNAVSFERDLTLPVSTINETEADLYDSNGRGHAVVSLPEMKRGRALLCFATVLARSKPWGAVLPRGASRLDLDHRSQAVAHCSAIGQLAWYELMARQGSMRFIRSASDLEQHWNEVDAGSADTPVGFVLVMEGADPITDPHELAYWFSRGLRQINLVHYGTNRYAAGTGAEGGITKDGLALLKELERFDMALDTTHLADQAFFEALDAFAGPVLASHQNCRSLVSAQRQFTDEQLRRLIERDAVIGAAMDNWMLLTGWKTGQTPRERVTLQNVADHIDHVCQLAGHHRCAAIGTDLDGGFGSEQAPNDVNSIADVQKLQVILAGRGYDEAAIDAIFFGNWLRFLQRTLPGGSPSASTAGDRGTLETSNT